MKRGLISGGLVALNVVLAALLILGWRERSGMERGAAAAKISEAARPLAETAAEKEKPAGKPQPRSPFQRMYSADARQFAENLRAIGCPEETVKDILVAEVSRRYRVREEALRPKPADHVPLTWSANPSERKLSERREEAAQITKEKAGALRQALGYEVPVEMPVYAARTSEVQFEELASGLAAAKRAMAEQVHDDYWHRVQLLQERTRGFWQSEDVAELEELKQQRARMLEEIVNGP